MKERDLVHLGEAVSTDMVSFLSVIDSWLILSLLLAYPDGTIAETAPRVATASSGMPKFIGETS